MKRILFLFLLVIFLAQLNKVVAQENDFGIWTSISAEKDLGKLNLEIEGEYRTAEQSSVTDRQGISLKADYKLIKPLKIGMSYQFINHHDLDNDDFQGRHRLNMFLQGKHELGRFTFGLRERVQCTFKDESERTYKMNPKWSLRQKFEVEYNIKKCKITPEFSAEAFYQLNNPDGNEFDELRYKLAAKYKISKHHHIELFGLIDKEINTKDAVSRFVLGTGYKYSF